MRLSISALDYKHGLCLDPCHFGFQPFTVKLLLTNTENLKQGSRRSDSFCINITLVVSEELVVEVWAGSRKICQEAIEIQARNDVAFPQGVAVKVERN